MVLNRDIKVNLRYAVGVYDLLACPLSSDDCTGSAQARQSFLPEADRLVVFVVCSMPDLSKDQQLAHQPHLVARLSDDFQSLIHGIEDESGLALSAASASHVRWHVIRAQVLGQNSDTIIIAVIAQTLE